jgi:hypothetical protein
MDPGTGRADAPRSVRIVASTTMSFDTTIDASTAAMSTSSSWMSSITINAGRPTSRRLNIEAPVDSDATTRTTARLDS